MLIFVLVVCLSVAGAVTWSVVLADDGSKTTRVDDDGFSMSVAGTRISAPAGVAEEGTTVTATSATMDVSNAAWGGVSTSHEGLDITLEGGARPQQPVQLQFRIPDDVEVPDGSVVLAVDDSPTMEKPELLAAQWNPGSRTVTTTEHFSKMGPVMAEANKNRQGFGHAVHKMVTSGTDQPACFGHESLGGPGKIVVTTQDPRPAWPCLTMEEDKLVLELLNNSR